MREKLLQLLFWFFYAATVVFWFKNSFSWLKEISLSPLIPFAGFIVISMVRLAARFRSYKPPRISFSKKKVLILLAILVIAAGVRIPWFLNGYGVNTSDDAVTMLMAKHIAEGKQPPVYFYGQLYQGSLYSHTAALFILFFGYSHFGMQISIFIFFLAFIALQFFLVDDLFSLKSAVPAALFYALPIGHLIYLSFFNSAAFPLVLLLGSLILRLSVGAVYKNKTHWIPAVGFFWGLAFWTHQITIGFILTSAVILIFNWKGRWKKYLSVPVYAALGGLPLILAEIFWDFRLLKFLWPAGEEHLGADSVFSSLELMTHLFSRPVGLSGHIVLAGVFAGSLVLIVPSLKSKRLVPQTLFSLFFFVFILIFLLSGFGGRNLVRYLFPLYFCLPVLLLGLFEPFRFRFKQAAMILTVLCVCAGLNFKGIQSDLREVKSSHRGNKEVLAAMENTGKRYWRGEFWTAYLLTALSGESIIADSFSVNRYYPYRLMYDNLSETENFVFFTGEKSPTPHMAERFMRLLDSFAVTYKKQAVENHILVYDIKTPVFPGALLAPVHPGFPFPELAETRLSEGILDLDITNSGEVMGADYWIHAGIPDYSSVVQKFPAAKGKTTVSLPSPPRRKFPVSFHLNYKGLKMAHTETHILYQGEREETGPEKRNKKMVCRSGFGSPVFLNGQRMRVCFKDANIEIRQRKEGAEKIQIQLHSPFDFNDPAWYGEFYQDIEIHLDGELIRADVLNPGENTVTVSLPGKNKKEGFFVLTLRFKYHSFFDFAPYGKTAALLGEVDFH